MGRIDYYEEPDEEKVEIYQPLSSFQDFILKLNQYTEILRHLSKKSTELLVDIKDLKEDMDDNKVNDLTYVKYTKEFNRIVFEFKEMMIKNEKY